MLKTIASSCFQLQSLKNTTFWSIERVAASFVQKYNLASIVNKKLSCNVIKGFWIDFHSAVAWLLCIKDKNNVCKLD